MVLPVSFSPVLGELLSYPQTRMVEVPGEEHTYFQREKPARMGSWEVWVPFSKGQL